MTIEKDYNEVLFEARAQSINVLRYLFDAYIYQHVSPSQMSSVEKISGSKIVDINASGSKLIIKIRKDMIRKKR